MEQLARSYLTTADPCTAAISPRPTVLAASYMSDRMAPRFTFKESVWRRSRT